MRSCFWFFLSFCLISLPVYANPVSGFADIHNHLFAELAFGGAWIHGSVSGPIEKALAACDADDHAETIIPFVSEFIGHTQGSSGDTGPHLEKREGYPSFKDWPRWDTIAHQQNWEGYLKSAHENGLNLLVASMVNFEPLCELMPKKNRKFEDCSDSLAVERQLQAARAFEKSHDWFKIVLNPSEARAAIHQGKLAVVLSIEVTHLFGDGEWKPEFEKAYASGVRTLQLAHQFNNRFTGVAIHNPVFRFLYWIEDFKKRGHWTGLFRPWEYGFQMTEDKGTHVWKNKQGLTSDGKELIEEMMKKGMLIDLAHESEVAVKDIQELAEPHHYPVYISHGHFREAMDDGKFSTWEKSSEAWVLRYVRDSGGIFGLRTGPEKTKRFEGTAVSNDCQGSTKSYAQTYQFGNAMKLPIAFGSDLNGFIQQLRPRFGNAEETCGAEREPGERTREQKAQKDPLGKRFDQSGFGDISQLPDVLSELKRFGVDTKTLESSAENFIRMWEKADAAKK